MNGSNGNNQGNGLPNLTPEQMQQGIKVAGQVNEAGKKAGGVKVLAGAAVAGGVVAGVAVGGVIPVVAGAAAVGYAATRSDAIGDAARATGRGVCTAATKAQEVNKEHNVTGRTMVAAKSLWSKAKEVNTQYQITTKLQQAAKEGATLAKETNDKYKITERATAAAKTGLQEAKEFNEKHDITGKVGQTVMKGIDAIGNSGNQQPGQGSTPVVDDTPTVPAGGPMPGARAQQHAPPLNAMPQQQYQAPPQQYQPTPQQMYPPPPPPQQAPPPYAPNGPPLQ
eukprot:TRINITY_DN69079_c0_g1_i1.p1 TRINITY_DN69079_c0_g1~~TRINITY_DN69079_c0_g1_i1.p1  ORF type:complete len:281 (+),score=61.90 TRINITY_DN69079_c0_g1_i1:38-880(+)